MRSAAFLGSYCIRRIQSLEKSVCSSDCDQKRIQDFVKSVANDKFFITRSCDMFQFAKPFLVKA